jgi:pimeloyl-ACP methyl ester carboxylesterase
MLIPFLHRIVRKNLIARGIASKRVDLGSVSMHYYEAAPAHPRDTVVLVHGLGTSASTWAHILPALSEKYRVLAPDLPGFGFSTPFPQPLTRPIETYANALGEFLGTILPGKSFALAGHSLGGWLTAKHALKHPRQVHHLILINTAGIYHQGAEKLVDLFDIRSTKDTNKLLDRLWMNYPWYFRLFTPFIFEDMVRRKVPDIVKGIQESDFVDSELETLHMPVSVIWGKGDALLPYETVRTLSERLQARTIHIIEQSGHVPQLEATGEFLTILEKVLDERIL